MARLGNKSILKKQKAFAAFQQNNIPEAKKLFEQLCKKDRTDVESFFLLGVINSMLGLHTDAAKTFSQVTRLSPQNPDAHNNLGLSLEGQGKSEKAIASFQNALQLNPNNAEFHFNLANTLESLSRFDEAVEHYQTANTLQPGNSDVYVNLGHAYQEQGKLVEAVGAYQHALEINPRYAQAYNNLGNTFKEQRLLAKAIDVYCEALVIKPDYIEALHNLGNAYLEEGRIDEALAAYSKVVELRSGCAEDYSTLLFTMNYSPSISVEQLHQAHIKYSERYASSLSMATGSHRNDCVSDRKLKIGYISPDFCTHSVAYYFEPVLAAHDKNAFEIYCYANVSKPDETTERLRVAASHWHDITSLSDEEVARQIQKDGIDILIDLAGHTLNNRLMVFARKPAPVQVTYLGYPNTTGLSTIDYRLTDKWADPKEQDAFYSEALVRLEQGFLCYQPPAKSPDVSTLPMDDTDYITFGSFNNLSKMVPEIIELWSRLLLEIPGSRLIVKNRSLRDETVCDYFMTQFAQQGIARERVELIGWLPNKDDHLKLYGRIDIGLDTFPYNGTTTTCEALWMGVPVITLCGDRHAARVGSSLLHQVGLEDLIAQSKNEYIEIAKQLASDLPRLQQLREGMRERMQNSSLCEEAGFTRQLEQAYRDMWSTWCEQQQKS